MNEGTNEEHLPDLDIRSNAGIVRSPLDEIKAIQTLLADVYKDAGDDALFSGSLFRTPMTPVRDSSGSRC